MAQLSSPGVAVTVIDESFYTPAAPGTTPLIIVASAESKQNGSATGIAGGTLAANAGQVYLLTSQKDLADTFGTPVFKTDANNNPIHAGEQNEYGLQAAYSYLGVSNRAYVVRANIDLNQLDALADAPLGDPEDNTYWFDTASTQYGIFEWNSAGARTTGGQTFTIKYPTIITAVSKLSAGAGSAPRASIGYVGDYVIDATTTVNTVYFKNASGMWVEVGSTSWASSWPAVTGTQALPTLGVGKSIKINTNIFTEPVNLAALVVAINASAPLQGFGISAAVVNGKLALYSDSTSMVVEAEGGTAGLTALGLTAGTYAPPKLTIAPHTSVPQYKTFDATPRPTGSLWIKTTEPNNGARWRVKNYNAASGAWVEKAAPLYATNQAALASLDSAGGGINLALKTIYVQYNTDEGGSNHTGPQLANFKLFYRSSVGATTIQSVDMSPSVFTAAKAVSFTIQESITGSATLANPVTIAFTTAGAAGGSLDAETLVAEIGSSGLVNISAEYDAATGKVTISHRQGGDFRMVDTSAAGAELSRLFTSYYTSPDNAGLATRNLWRDPSDPADNTKYLASLWASTVISAAGSRIGFANASADAPSTIPASGKLWYNSMIDEVDMLIHNGTTWVGYGNYDQTAPGGEATDPNGPIVSATRPAVQSDGTALGNGDLWIDTSDLENFPKIYKFNYVTKKWVLVDNSDQSSEDGVLFRDARWGVNGGTSAMPTDSTITELLTSNFLDFDAPDPALYPKGMLLWNLRRSGFNVKRFVRDYVNVEADNKRLAGDPSMAEYYPHRWISEAGNQEDGSGTFGRKAQRKVVIQALQALVNANQQIRDEESRVFNLIACPGYSELVGEMVSLNYDRGLTAFIVADTPPRLTPDATSLSNWGNNVKGALEDNDNGLVSSDEYLGFFYPWGFTSDNIGNNVAVPPSHMMLRTIALSDNVAYPWFAPAGTRRGGITNATAVGYITSEGEFQSVALNNGQRDTLASIKVNPLTFITGTGLVNYGQYTRAKNASSLDRINVARLVIYLRRQFAQLAEPYVFEPNDTITRNEIKGAAESLLLELVGQRALYDYLVVCDTSNNTPARIDRSELYLDVAIEPVKAVEFIYIPLRLKNTGEIKGLG
jgi:hypothetical protein